MAKRSFSRLYKIAVGGENETTLAGRLEHFAHFCFFVWKSFVRNRCLVRASALSYTSLLALIPLLAIAISVTSSLLKKQGEQQIYRAVDHFVSSVMPPATVTNTPPAPEMTNNNATATNAVPPSENAKARVTVQNVAARQIHEFIRNTNSGTLGVTGVAMLILVAISMLSSVESTFDDIWGVEHGRGWLVRVARYWFAISLGPVLIAVALSLAGGSHFDAVKAFLRTSPIIGGSILQIGDILFIWLVFALFYQFVPNTKVQFSAALAGGIVAGTLWHLNNLFGFLYVSRVVTNSKIYGGLGLIPVFMAGLYLSWAVVLLGAQIAYAFQNRKISIQEKMVETVSHRDREVVALRVMTAIGTRFQRGEKPAEIHEVADELAIPTQLAQQVLQRLLAANILTEIERNTTYVPSRPLGSVTVHDVIQAMRSYGQDMPLPRTDLSVEILEEFEKVEKAESAAASPVTLLMLVQRSGKPSAS